MKETMDDSPVGILKQRVAELRQQLDQELLADIASLEKAIAKIEGPPKTDNPPVRPGQWEGVIISIAAQHYLSEKPSHEATTVELLKALQLSGAVTKRGNKTPTARDIRLLANNKHTFVYDQMDDVIRMIREKKPRKIPTLVTKKPGPKKVSNN